MSKSSQELIDAVSYKTVWFAGYLSELYRLRRVARRLDLPEDVYGYANVNQPDGKERSQILLCADEEKMGATARAILPVVGSFQKKFKESDGTMELLGRVDGIEVLIVGKPPASCKVKKVVTETKLSAVPAHTEKVTTYVMEGDCDPLLKPPASEPVTVPEETQSPTEENV